MKVYFINSVVDYGSTGKIVRDLSEELLKNNNEVRIAYGRKDSKNDTNTLNLSSRVGFGIHYIMSRVFGRHGLHSHKATKRLIKDLEDFKPDVIHIHNLHGYYLNVPMLLEYIKKSDIKTIITLHDTWLISGNSASFEFDGCAVWDDGCVVCNNTKSYPRSEFGLRQRKNFKWKKEAFSGFKNLTFISPSIWLKDIIANSFLKEHPYEVVNNGIDTSIFYERKPEALIETYKDRKVILGVASVWDERKGLTDLIKLDSMLDDSYQIIIIGLNKQQLSSLPQSIVGIERTNDAHELAEYYSIAHAFVNPTYEDNYPTTNLEARSVNTPVVAYDTGGNKEVEGVIIVKQGDLDAMKSELMNLESNSRLQNTQDHSKELFIKKMMKYYS